MNNGSVVISKCNSGNEAVRKAIVEDTQSEIVDTLLNDTSYQEEFIKLENEKTVSWAGVESTCVATSLDEL